MIPLLTRDPLLSGLRFSRGDFRQRRRGWRRCCFSLGRGGGALGRDGSSGRGFVIRGTMTLTAWRAFLLAVRTPLVAATGGS